MAINIQFERRAEILIGKIAGRIDTTTAHDLHKHLDAEIAAADHGLLLDFEHVSYISSSGLRVLLTLAKRFKEPGQRFGLCSPSESVREILTVSGFDQLLAIYASQPTALSEITNR